MNILPIERDGSAVDLFETIDGTEQCGFAGAGRAADDDNLAPRNFGVDILQNLVVAITLADIGNADGLLC
ncbi:hypothetical protein D3C78_1953770 [compost metagenome]